MGSGETAHLQVAGAARSRSPCLLLLPSPPLAAPSSPFPLLLPRTRPCAVCRLKVVAPAVHAQPCPSSLSSTHTPSPASPPPPPPPRPPPPAPDPRAAPLLPP